MHFDTIDNVNIFNSNLYEIYTINQNQVTWNYVSKV